MEEDTEETEEVSEAKNSLILEALSTLDWAILKK